MPSAKAGKRAKSLAKRKPGRGRSGRLRGFITRNPKVYQCGTGLKTVYTGIQPRIFGAASTCHFRTLEEINESSADTKRYYRHLHALLARVHVGDSGKLLTEACVVGVAHSPGYPLLLERVIRWLTQKINSQLLFVVAANAFNALLVALVAAGIAHTVDVLMDTHPPVAAVVAGLAFAMSELTDVRRGVEVQYSSSASCCNPRIHSSNKLWLDPRGGCAQLSALCGASCACRAAFPASNCGESAARSARVRARHREPSHDRLRAL